MDDEQILERINNYVNEEHSLYRRSEEDGGLTPEERDRLHGLKIALDQFWDLLDQRRALRAAGRDPNQANLRDAQTVEKYLQ